MHAKGYSAALLRGKCPHCRQGDIFKYPVLGNLAQFNVMNEKCPECNVRLEPEPGFYQGAMYVGYGFTVAIIILVGVVLYFLGDPSEWVYVGVSIGIMVLLIPYNYRYSRIVYLHLFGGIKFDPTLSK